jgi:hypothetical protein
LREDALSKLDRFRARISNLLGNTLRLQHMDAAAAEDALRKPLEVYNMRCSTSAGGVTIEDGLVNAILAQVRTEEVQLAQAAGVGQAETSDDTVRIEAPFLQLVMTRLWNEEIQANSRILRLSTLERLGGAQEIVRTHLDGVMRKLGAAEQEVCSRFFDRMVTPSGSKIACSVDNLTKWAGTLAVCVPSVLQILSASRILRSVAAPTGSNEVDYEIFHDVLAPAILSWRTQYIQAQERSEAQRRAEEQQRLAEEQARAEEQSRVAGRLRRLARTLLVVSLLAVGVAVFAVWQARRAETARQDEERQRTVAQEALAAAEAALAAAPEQSTATGVAAELLGKAQTEYAAAQRPKQAAPKVTSSLPTRIYIQIQDAQQRTRAEQIEKALEAQKFIVPGIERLKTGPRTGAEVRYFRTEEKDEADRIVNVLQDLQVQGAQAKYIPGYEGSTKIRPKHYEIWFAPDALN